MQIIMGKRIIVRTTANVSFAGNICEFNIFNSSGIVIAPNPKLNAKVFIPEEEIQELVVDGKIISYKEYLYI
jgi:hypothetical protein